MNKYLLLRDNKQTGPHSLQEIRQLGLKGYDLIWIEGKSAAWRYAGEIEEMKSFAPMVEEQPFDRFFKRPVREEQEATTVQQLKKTAQNKQEKLQPDQAKQAHQELPLVAKKEFQINGEQQEFQHMEKPQELHHTTKPAKKYVSVSMPSRNSKPLAQRTSVAMQSEPAVNAAYASSTQPSPGQTNASDFTTQTNTFFGAIHMDKEKPNHGFPEWVRTNSREILQYVGLGLALGSLLLIGVLIGMGMSSDPVPPPVTKTHVTPPSSNTGHITKQDPAIIAIPASTTVSQDADAGDPDLNRIDGNTATDVTEKRSANKEKPVVNSQLVPDNNLKNITTDGGSASAKEKVDVGETAAKQEPAKPSSLSSEVAVKMNDYKINMFGGIDDIEVTVNNNSLFPLDLVVVEVNYIQSNKKVYKTETLRLKNIASGGSATAQAPKTNRGIKLNSRITYITSSKAGISENL